MLGPDVGMNTWVWAECVTCDFLPHRVILFMHNSSEWFSFPMLDSGSESVHALDINPCVCVCY